MSSIDERIVEMRFNNAQFERGIRDSQRSLQDFEQSLNLTGAETGINNLGTAVSNFNLGPMAAPIDMVIDRFRVLGAIGFTVIQDLTRAAGRFARRKIGDIVSPFTEGGWNRALNLEQAEFQFEGLGMDVDAAMDAALYAVQDTAFGLDEAAVAAANFGATGMEAGDEMAAALRGISGVASMAGSSYSDVANIFGKVAGQGRLMGDDLNRLAAQGINAAATLAEQMGITEREVRDMVSKGEVSFEMFAESMNEAFGEHATKANETYTGSLANLGAAASRLGAAFATPHLPRMRDIFNSMTPVLNDLFTQMEPLIQFINWELDGAGRAVVDFFDSFRVSGMNTWMDPFISTLENVLGIAVEVTSAIFEAWTDVFPPLSHVGVFRIIEGFKSFSQTVRVALESSDGLQRTLRGVFSIFGIVWEIIKSVVSGITDLVGITAKGTVGFLDFTGSIGDVIYNFHQALKEGNALSTLFEGIGKVIGFVIETVKSFAGAIGQLFSGGDNASAAFSDFVGQFGESVSAFGGWGEALGSAFGGVMDTIQPFLEGLAELFGGAAEMLGNIMRDLDLDGLTSIFNSAIFVYAVSGLRNFMVMLGRLERGNVLGTVLDLFTGIGGYAQGAGNVLDGINGVLFNMQNKLKADTLLKLGGALALITASVAVLSMIDPGDLAKSLAGLTAMFTQLIVTMGLLQKFSADFGMLDIVSLGVALTLLAAAVAILSVSVLALSTLDWDELFRGLTGVTVLLGALVAASQGLKAAGPGMIVSAIGMVILGAAIRILVGAVEALSSLNWEELSKGLVGVGGLLASLVLFTRFANASLRGAVAAVGILLLASAIAVLANVVQTFASMDIGGLIQGLGGLAVVLASLAAFVNMTKGGRGMIKTATGLLILSNALETITAAVKELGTMSLADLTKGLVGMAGALLIIAGAMQLMPANMVVTAAGLFVVAEALVTLAGALDVMGGMSWDEIARGLTALAGSLLILVVAMAGMTSALAGAAALFVISSALAIFAPVLASLGNLSWGVILTGLGALAAAIAVLGVAALVLTPVIPAMLGLGAALILIGLGVGAAAAGIGLLASGLAALALAGSAATTVVLGLITGMLNLIPLAATKIGEGLVAIAGVITEGAPAIAEAIVAILESVLLAIQEIMPLIIETFQLIISSFLDAIVDLTPEIGAAARVLIMELLETIQTVGPEITETFQILIISLLQAIQNLAPEISNTFLVLIQTLLNTIVTAVPMFVTAAIELIVGILEGIAQGIPDIIRAGTDVIIAFIEGIGEMASEVTAAGFDTIITFVESLTDTINENMDRMHTAGKDLAFAIINGMTGGLAEKAKGVIDSVKGIASDAIAGAKNLLGINSPSRVFQEIGEWTGEGMMMGIDSMGRAVYASSEGVGVSAVEGMRDSLKGMPDALDGIDTEPVIKPVLDLSDIRKDAKELGKLVRQGELDLARESYARASNILLDRARKSDNSESNDSKDGGSEGNTTILNYTQNNTSPKALSDIEIYRRTKNQLSVAKGGLGDLIQS